MTDPAPVAVKIVSGQSVVRVIVRSPSLRSPCSGALAIDVICIRACVIGIDDVGECRHQHAHLRARSATLRAHEKRDHVLMLTTPNAGGIYATSHIRWHSKAEIRFPVAVVDVVIVKVNSSVLVRRVPPTHFFSGPARAGHRSGGKINQFTVQAVGPSIYDSRAWDIN